MNIGEEVHSTNETKKRTDFEEESPATGKSDQDRFSSCNTFVFSPPFFKPDFAVSLFQVNSRDMIDAQAIFLTRLFAILSDRIFGRIYRS